MRILIDGPTSSRFRVRGKPVPAFELTTLVWFSLTCNDGAANAELWHPYEHEKGGKFSPPSSYLVTFANLADR